MIKSPFTKDQRKKAKLSHKADKRLDPAWFEAKRVDLGSQIVTAVTKRPPIWGAFKFNFSKVAI